MSVEVIEAPSTMPYPPVNADGSSIARAFYHALQVCTAYARYPEADAIQAAYILGLSTDGLARLSHAEQMVRSDKSFTAPLGSRFEVYLEPFDRLVVPEAATKWGRPHTEEVMIPVETDLLGTPVTGKYIGYGSRASGMGHLALPRMDLDINGQSVQLELSEASLCQPALRSIRVVEAPPSEIVAATAGQIATWLASQDELPKGWRTQLPQA